MRELLMEDRFKLRGIHPILQELLEVKYIDYVKGTVDFGDGDIFPIDDNIKLQQCTGSRDIKGNLIYEGDIIRTITNATYYITIKSLYKVIWEPKYCQFLAENGSGICIDLMDAKDVEVIGNVYYTSRLIIDTSEDK